MNINKAKAVAGISFKVNGRAALISAEAHCKNEIVAARKSGNEVRAALLSEAKAVFQKRSRRQNSCAFCGVTISRGATHCRIHSKHQTKMIAAPDSWQPEQKAKRAENNNARVAMMDPKGGHLATLGYYATPVKRIITKWRGDIDEETLKRYFFMVAMPLLYPSCDLIVPKDKPARHWQAIHELGATISALYNDNDSVEAWLLKQPSIAIGKPTTTWRETIERIVTSGGPRYTVNQVALASKRMMLNSDAAAAKSFKRDFYRFTVSSCQKPT